MKRHSRARFRASKIGLNNLSSLPIDRSKVFHLLQFILVCASAILYVAFVLSFLFVPHLFLFWSIRRAVLSDCGTSWVYSHIFPLKGKQATIGNDAFPFKEDPFSEGGWGARKQSGSHKSCLPRYKWRKQIIMRMRSFIRAFTLHWCIL